MIIAIFKADQVHVIPEHRFALYIQYLICLSSTCDLEKMVGVQVADWTQVASVVSVFSLIAGVLAAGVFAFCLLRHGHIGLTEQSPLSIKIAVRVGFITKKVFFPICLWSLIRLLSSPNSKLAFLITSGLATAILLPLAAGVIVLLSNTVQSDAAMVSLNNKNDIQLYLTLMLANAVGLIGQSFKSTGGAVSFKILTLIIEASVMGYYMTNHNFLNQTFNNMFLIL